MKSSGIELIFIKCKIDYILAKNGIATEFIINLHERNSELSIRDLFEWRNKVPKATREERKMTVRCILWEMVRLL